MIRHTLTVAVPARLRETVRPALDKLDLGATLMDVGDTTVLRFDVDARDLYCAINRASVTMREEIAAVLLDPDGWLTWAVLDTVRVEPAREGDAL